MRTGYLGAVHPPELVDQLNRSQCLGFLGPGPVTDHIAHADGFLAALEGISGTVVDLGAGGGVPGLVVAMARPDLRLVLLDAMAKRCRFLEEAVRELELEAEVVEGRAEEIGRSSRRGSASAVIARSFGSPSATAECGSPLLSTGGYLIVSEPPGDSDRWPSEGLSQLGLAPVDRRSVGESTVQILRQATVCPDRFPRRNGIPSKRPLFG